jgi:hypothetical protein
MLGFTADGEAEVVLESGAQLPFLGVLLALPLLVETGLMAAARKVYGRLKKGVYGLRATIQLLFVMALLRSPRPESLKGRDPRAMGDVLGLERAPEVKTVRRKLSEIATLGKAHELLRELGQQWLRDRDRDDVLGVLYVDGHVRVYHGQRKLPKAHVTQRNQALPATTDYWVNDVQGEPVFVMTASANEAMTKVLPALLAEVKELGEGRTGTVVFDRGGWSIGLFRALLEAGWDILTYRKGQHRSHPRTGFAEHKMDIDGREVTLNLSVRTIRLGKGKGKQLKLREIAELRDDGGQTIIVTSHFDQPIVLLAHRMFERWRQENYFRYMKENFELDALVDYAFENDDPVRDVPNPAYKAMTNKLQEARAELARCEQAYGQAAIDNVEAQRPTARGFKIANAELGKSLKAARERVEKLVARRKSLPKRVPIGSVLGDEKVIRLSRERKLFTDAIKAAAYRAESALLRLLRPHFRRSEDEGRAFLRDTMLQPGDLLVDGDCVLVRLAPKSAPRYTEALRGLCEELNKLNLRFPETAYSLRYEVASSPEDR